MATSYFDLSAEDQGSLLAQAEIETGRAQAVIEKDIWVSVVLRELFSMPERKLMAFKGGTSLSKVYSVIHRFSEDIDITIDYRELGCEYTLADLVGLSRGKRDKVSDELKAKVKDYTSNTVQPYLLARLHTLGCGDECTVSADEKGETLLVGYPSRVAERGTYMLQHVKVEFGGRNIIEPNAVHTIVPDVGDLFPNVEFPTAEGVVVLAAERTFWEKVTLIHDECNRGISVDSGRLSRHWYDLAMLSRHDCGQRAVADRSLLADVIDIKNVFFRRATSQYELCLAGALVLIPNAENVVQLGRDYDAMQASGMLNGHVLTLEEILVDLAALQDQINNKASTPLRAQT